MALFTADRWHKFFVTVAHFAPAYLLLAGVGLLASPLSLIFMLCANVLMITAMSHAMGFGTHASFLRNLMQRGLVYFILLTGYTALVAVLLAVPVLWVLQVGSLLAALLLSVAFVVAMLALWRFWPAFTLSFVWDDAYPHAEHGSWLTTALRRSLDFARHLTGDQDLFFSHGLPASLLLLLLSTCMLSLAGLCEVLPSEFRITALAIYGVLVMPLGNWVLINRTVRALLTEVAAHQKIESLAVAQDAPNPVLDMGLPAGIALAELNATLLCAARSGQVDLALAALQRGADPNTVPELHDRDQRSALICAVTLPDLRLLRSLIAQGADINRAHMGLIPLIAATRDSYQGRPDAVMTLLANGADPRMTDAELNTALHYAALCAEPVVAALLLDTEIDVDAINAEGMSPLGIACINGNWKVAAFFLEHGASPAPDHAQPALILAAMVHEDDPTGIKLLLKHKVTVDARGSLERTALMTAALLGHARIVELLLAAGADIDNVDQNGTTALMEAARCGSVAVIQLLAKRKACADRVDTSGRCALMIACQSRHVSEDVVRTLLALGADRRLQGKDGKRALDYAAAAGRWHIVALLDPDYPIPSNFTPQMLMADVAHDSAHLLDALRFGHWDVVADFMANSPSCTQSEWLALYLELNGVEHAQARVWVLNRNLDIEGTCADGRSLLATLLAGLPDTQASIEDLVARGVCLGRAGLLTHVLAVPSNRQHYQSLRGLVHDLFWRGADWCGLLPNGKSALHLAVSWGDCDLVAWLLERGHDPNLRDRVGDTPLHYVCRLEVTLAAPLLSILIRYGANPHIAAANGETSLGLALQCAQPDFAYWLHWNNWCLPGRSLQPTDIPAAAALGDSMAVERLLALGFPIDTPDAKGATALIRAAGSGHVELVGRLLAWGASVDCTAHSGVTCLFAAVNAKQDVVVQMLLDHGVPVDQRVPGAGTPLILAVARGLPKLARLLLQQGADSNAVDDQGMTVMHVAAQFAFDHPGNEVAYELLELLLKHGARLDARNAAGQDALLVLLGACVKPGAARKLHKLSVLVNLLLDHNAKVDTQDDRGVSVLHACAMHGLLEPLQVLITRGANLNSRDIMGRTASDVANLLGFVDLAAELKSI